MRLREIRAIYPNAASLIRRLADMGQTTVEAGEGLSAYALQRIEDGTTPEADAVMLLTARASMGRKR
ncbi:hypothetical protein [Thioalkalivibrio sp.]|uniref:hypothetical protein n=1 Tax=Thioalkalivibrio sp. TaxID=2093813 RepID=UPI00356B48E6